jgi:hypothetical protein
MNRIRKWKAFLIFVSSCFSCLLISGSAAVRGYDIPEPGAPECVPVPGISDCGTGGQDYPQGNGGNGGGGGIFNLIDRWQEKAEERRRAEEQQRKQEAYNLNEQGNRAFEKRDWATAVDFYEKALKKSPNDKVIQQNFKNAEIEKKRQEELRGEQADYSKRMKKLAALMPVSKPLSFAEPGQVSGSARATVPLPGFSSEQWKEYMDAQEVVVSLYTKLNREGVLSDADAKTFYAALNRRNELWAVNTAQPHTVAERDNLRLSLPVVVNKAIMDLTLIMQGIQPNSQNNTSTPTTLPVISPDRRKGSAADSGSSEADAITNAFVAEFFTDKITELSENEVGSTIEQVHGDKMKNRYEGLLGLGKVAVKAKEGGVAGAAAEIADLIISKMPEPLTARAEHAVEGGRKYSNVAYHALNRFMVDAMKLTGSGFDTEAFWKRVEQDLTESQKGVKKWIQFGE